MRLLTLFLLTLSLAAQADILVIGDSHTAGPFGKYLHQKLTSQNPGQLVLTYGHSSSAPLHWWDQNNYNLTGGIAHRLGLDELQLNHPTPTHWQRPVSVPKLKQVLESPILHAQWLAKLEQRTPNITHIVIALGANDRPAVSRDSGEPTAEYSKRVAILKEMLKEIQQQGIKCIWIGPPSSISRSKLKEQTTQQYLEEGIAGACPLFDSRKFVARHCDKVHFNCAPALPQAQQWATEVADFIESNM